MARWRRGVPAWSPFRRGRAHARFVGLLEDRLRAAGIAVEGGDDGAYHVGDGDLRVGELAELCAVTDESDWRELIALRLDAVRIAAAQAVERPTDTPAATVEGVGLRASLRPRLHASDDLAALGACVARPVADGLVEVIACDRPAAVEVPSRAELARLRLTDDGLFALAVDNLRAHERPQLVPDETGGVDVLIAESDGFFTAAWAPRVDELVAVDRDRGALVGIPSRHSLLLHPVDDAGAADAVTLMLPMIHGAYGRAPAALSPELWWWRGPGLTPLPLALDGDRLALSPPDDLAAVLAALR